ncbi:hypothetical protein [Mesorhizobium caraganae]|uniref:hypothetical protein n=1 Tax=Mesorhizobium caraganae TaxID=483206 RepID=UPI00177E62F9|nr:hypothetical protein [Mesorhizobium caraganae]
MSAYLAAYLYLVGCLGAAQYADILKTDTKTSLGMFVYVLVWPIIIPAIWMLAFLAAMTNAVRK